MPDPFRSNPKSQLIREAQIGLSAVGILFCLFVYVAFYKLTGRGQHLPEHVRNAPVAETIWPGAMPSREIEMSQRELPDFRRSGLSQQKQNGNSENRMPSRERDMLDSPSSMQASIASSNPPELPVSRTESVPPPAIAETNKSPGLGEQLKTLLGGFAPQRDNVPGVTNPKSSASPSEVAAAATPSLQLSGDSTALKEGGSEAWVPPLPPTALTMQAGETSPEVQLTSAETTGTDFVPTVEIGTASSQAKTKSSDFNPGGEFNPNSDFPIEERQNQPARKTIAEPMIPTATDFDTANVATPAISELDPADGDWSGSESELKLIAPKPFTNANAETIRRQLPRPEAIPMAGNVGPAEQDSLERTYSGTSLTADAAAHSDYARCQSLTYIVQDGDSFWSIAQSLYGDGRYFRALYKYNETTVPEFDSLSAGTQLGTPCREDLAKIWPDLCPKRDSDQEGIEGDPSDAADRIYVTQAGDTLFEIARQKLGQASRYLEIKQMNDVRLDEHADHLSPLRHGVRLVLPAQ